MEISLDVTKSEIGFLTPCSTYETHSSGHVSYACFSSLVGAPRHQPSFLTKTMSKAGAFFAEVAEPSSAISTRLGVIDSISYMLPTARGEFDKNGGPYGT